MFGFAVALSVLALVLLLPLVTSARLLRMNRELADLRARLDELEARIGARSAVSATPITTPAAAPRPEPAPPQPLPISPPAPGFRPSPAPSVSAQPAPAVASSAVSPGIAQEPGEGEALDLEGRIGGRGLLYTGVLVLLLGVSFFLKYAFDNDWINEVGRVVISAIAGIALTVAGTQLTRRELRTFGQALIGTGLAILYLSIYAALAAYALISETTAFTLMVAVTVVAALFSDRERSQPMALIAVGGGFLTPFLVATGKDAQLTLFTYDALLVAGTMILSRRHGWYALDAAAYMMTVVSIAAWAAFHYSDVAWFRTLLFLTLFCVMFVQILRETRRAPTFIARGVTVLLATAPVLYHVAAVVITARHPPAIHIYLIAFTAVGLLVTADRAQSGIRLLLLLAGYLPLFGSLTLPDGLSWLVPNLVAICGVAALHLLALLDRSLRQQQMLDASDRLSLHVAAIGLFGLLYEALEYSYPGVRGLLAALLATGAAALWRLLARHDMLASLNAAALAVTLGAIAIAVQFDGAIVVIGWAAEGAGVAWLGLRAGSRWLQAGGLLLWSLAVARLFSMYSVTPAGFIAVLNQRAVATAFVVTLAYILGILYARHRHIVPEAGRARALFHVVASVVTMLWITSEIRSYWDIRYDRPQAYLYEQLVLSLAWGIYGAALIVIGLARGYAPDRYIGITVLAITIIKVFLYDLLELGGIYRVIGFIAFGALLVAVSYLYQQRRKADPARNA